jgi:hypothetical protein
MSECAHCTVTSPETHDEQGLARLTGRYMLSTNLDELRYPAANRAASLMSLAMNEYDNWSRSRQITHDFVAVRGGIR